MINWTHKVLPSLGLATLMTTALLTGCDAEEPATTDDTPVTEATIQPFSIAARVSGATVSEVTASLTSHIHSVDDTSLGLPGDWKVAGGEHVDEAESPSTAALKLPDGSRIIEVCNHFYAEKAMAFGAHHGVALPCEISVSQVGDDVEVVLLNPESIFGVFFGDVPPEHAESMSTVASMVRGELEDLVAAGVAEHDAEFPLEDVGPSWTSEDLRVFSGMQNAVVLDVQIPAGYQHEGGPEAFRQLYVESLLDTLTHEEMDHVGSQVPGLSVDDWRAARPHALSLPGNVKVVEMCSPTYAKAALSTGTHHAPALPCQTAIWTDGDMLRVHLLDPGFIFPVFFSDAPAEMMESMGGMASAVRQDLQQIVATAADRTVMLAAATDG